MWFMVFVQLNYITDLEEIFIFINKKCRIYTALGVLKTPKFFENERRFEYEIQGNQKFG